MERGFTFTFGFWFLVCFSCLVEGLVYLSREVGVCGWMDGWMDGWMVLLTYMLGCGLFGFDFRVI